MEWGGTLFTKADIEVGKANERTLAQIGEDLWMGSPADRLETEEKDWFINHSCDPNLWMQDEVTLAARRDITAGEEVTMDYAMHFADPNWKMKNLCECSSPLCRKSITGKDWKLKELQDRYGSHFSPLINRLIEERPGIKG